MKKKSFAILFISLIFALLAVSCAKTQSGAVTTEILEDTNGDNTPFETTISVHITSGAPVTTAHVPDREGRPEDTEMHYTYSEIVERMMSTDYLSEKNIGEVSKEFTSYDRASKIVNGEYLAWNANGDGGGYIRKEKDGGTVIAEMDGPGYISRIWSAAPRLGKIKIYIDGEEEPTIDMPFENLFKGSAAPFNYTALCYNQNAGQGKNCFVPITYNKSCKVVVYGDWGEFYHINYTTLANGYTVDRMPKTLSKEDKASLSLVNKYFRVNIGKDPLGKDDPEMKSFTVSRENSAVLTFNGKEIIRGFFVKVNYEGDKNSYENVLLFKHLQIKMFWDGMDTPFVDAPLGDFFGSAYGVTDIKTLLLGVRKDGTFYNYFTMPYLESARIEISYLGEGSVQLSVGANREKLESDDIMYYCALFTRGEYDKTPGKHPDYHFLTVNGSGRIVGLTLHSSKCTNIIDPASFPGSPWWGEGDEKFYIDGEEFPSWFGTGTEDFFGYAWCDGTLFNRPYHSQSYCVGGSNSKGNRSVTRIMLADSIPFEKSFEGYLEKYYTDEHVKFAFTVYFYMSKESTASRDNYTKEDLESYFYPDPGSFASNYTEGEYLKTSEIKTVAGKVYRQNVASFGSYWSENEHIMMSGFRIGDYVDFVLPSEKSGEYILLASFTKAPDYGMIRVSVNGKDFDEVHDLYHTSVIADTLSLIGEVSVKEGFNNTLRITFAGKNAKSLNNFAGIDFVILVPKGEFTSLSEFDLSKYTSVRRINTWHEEKDFIRFEGEDSLASAKVSTGGLSAQPMLQFGSDWSENSQLWWTGGKEGATLKYTVFVPADGIYDISGGFTISADYGIFEVYLDGEKIGEAFDGFNNGVRLRSADFGALELTKGYHEITFKIIGKNTFSVGYMVGIDYVDIKKKD